MAIECTKTDKCPPHDVQLLVKPIGFQRNEAPVERNWVYQISVKNLMRHSHDAWSMWAVCNIQGKWKRDTKVKDAAMAMRTHRETRVSVGDTTMQSLTGSVPQMSTLGA